jgi:long-chain acyl-CoA synthetase
VTATVADLLSRAAAEAPDAVALVAAASGVGTTWSALDEAATRIARGLEEQGLVAGNRVALVAANRAELVPVYLGVLRARMVAVPVNPQAATGELLRVVADSGARLVVADRSAVDAARLVVAGLADVVKAGVTGAGVVTAGPGLHADGPAPRLATLDCPAGPGELTVEGLLAVAPGPLPPARDPESLAALLYTSGDAARTRGAMLTHRALLANVEQVAGIEPPLVEADDVVYGVLPLFHVYGLNAVLGQVLRQHARLVVVDSFDPDVALEDIERFGVTVVPVAPSVLAHWRRRDDLGARLAGVRTLLSGSAPLSPELATDLQERFGLVVHQGYGLTEAAPVVTSTLCSSGPPKPGSVGAPLPGVRIRLVDDTGEPPAPGDPGQILVSGDNLFDGYWPDRSDGPDDGWFATGDVGYLDADGDLFLVDRLKQLVVVSGFNVYPSEVEEVLREVDGVLEAAVVGVPDERTGEAVVAYLHLDTRVEQEVGELLGRVRATCVRRLARFKVPSRIEVVTELPHTPSGKIAKGRLRSTLRRDRSGLLD